MSIFSKSSVLTVPQPVIEKMFQRRFGVVEGKFFVEPVSEIAQSGLFSDSRFSIAFTFARNQIFYGNYLCKFKHDALQSGVDQDQMTGHIINVGDSYIYIAKGYAQHSSFLESSSIQSYVATSEMPLMLNYVQFNFPTVVWREMVIIYDGWLCTFDEAVVSSSPSASLKMDIRSRKLAY